MTGHGGPLFSGTYAKTLPLGARPTVEALLAGIRLRRKIQGRAQEAPFVAALDRWLAALPEELWDQSIELAALESRVGGWASPHLYR